MERTTSLKRAKEIMISNFIGPKELKAIGKEMGILIPDNFTEQVSTVNFSENLLLNCKNDYLLIMGIPFYKDGSQLTIVKMREHFGCDPSIYEPCFYNQDWYLKEEFANKKVLTAKWYLLKKSVEENSRGKDPNLIRDNLGKNQKYPSAILITFAFFSVYFLYNIILWRNEFIWCEDYDHNGDQIYVGRYIDSTNMNNNGFSVHRNLKINNQYCSLIEYNPS